MFKSHETSPVLSELALHPAPLPDAHARYAPQLEDYLPHTDKLDLCVQLPAYARAWARLTAHDALRPLVAQPSSTPVQVLAEAREIMTHLEAAITAWSEAVEIFATHIAPQLEDRIEMMPGADYEDVLVAVLDREFFGPLAPHRAGVWVAADRVIHTSLRDLRERGYINVEDVVFLQQNTLLELPIEIRAVRLGLAKFAFDVALGHCPTPEERRRAELCLAREVEAIYGTTGLVRAWAKNEPQRIEDLESAWDGHIAEAREARITTLWNMLRLPLPVWQFMGDFLGRDPEDELRYGGWLYTCADELEPIRT